MTLYRFLPLALLLLSGVGCSSHYEMQDLEDEGSVFERLAHREKRDEKFSQAADSFAKAGAKYLPAHAIAVERENGVFKRHLRLKLATVFAGEAHCRRPDKDTTSGDWKKSKELFLEATSWAIDGGFIRMERDMLVGQAECLRPDNNPQGSWEEAGKLYAKAVALSREIRDDEGIGATLSAHAICLLEGPTLEKLNDKIRKLLIEASKLGNKSAAELLSQTGARFCFACSNEIKGDVRFCPKCGHDQVQKPKVVTAPGPREPPPE
ncbi:MAG: zinc ribbon domain-containing protein [Planctomycetes bacterium]|nr:zinc ribbon domain-containing protein [Planctomycetota bacterium]